MTGEEATSTRQGRRVTEMAAGLTGSGDYRPALIVRPSEHTMGDSLLRYIEIKMHHLIRDTHPRKVVVRGRHDRNSAIVSRHEKTGKLFNWMRPTATVRGHDEIVLNVYPGACYAFHYASLVATFFAGQGLLDRTVTCEVVRPSAQVTTLLSSNISRIPDSDVVVLGLVEELAPMLLPGSWEGDGPFRWRAGVIEGQTMLLLGCEHSYWGDIAGSLVRVLASLGTKAVLYVGKLGALCPSVRPNEALATGESTILAGQVIRWKNLFVDSVPFLIRGDHYTLPSVIQETLAWHAEARLCAHFVDPEIGFMAQAAAEANIRFSYFHIVSDNLGAKYDDDLSNERPRDAARKRSLLLPHIASALRSALRELS